MALPVLPVEDMMTGESWKLESCYVMICQISIHTYMSRSLTVYLLEDLD